MSAAMGFQAVEEIAARLADNAGSWQPEEFPEASSFLSRGAAGQRNRLAVFLIADRAAESRGGRGPVVQVVTAEIGLLLLLPRRNDRGGARARAKAETFVDAARQRLLGPADPAQGNAAWVPKGFKRPLAWLGGALEPHDDDDNYWVWLDRYTVEWVLDSQQFNGA